MRRAKNWKRAVAICSKNSNPFTARLRIIAMSSSDKTEIAIIGTGMAGLACADGLSAGFTVSLFDKSRGLSGRLSTRRADARGVKYTFDHGTQYFRATQDDFVAWLKPFETAGHVRVWSPHHVLIDRDGHVTEQDDVAKKLVFAPGMNGIGKALLAGRPQWRLYLDCGIERIEGQAGAWMLHAGASVFGPFAQIVLAMPPVQAAALLPEGVSFATALGQAKMQGCHTLMLGYEDDEAPDAAWQCAHFDDEVLGFAAVNSSKPGRGGGFALSLQTRHDWSEAHIEDDPDDVAMLMRARFHALTDWPVEASGYARLHRWRYASTRQVAADRARPFLSDTTQAIAAIGDWCTGSKVEDAFLSGRALAKALNG